MPESKENPLRVKVVTAILFSAPFVEAVVGVGIGTAGVIFNEPAAQGLGIGLSAKGTVLSGIVTYAGLFYHEKPRELPQQKQLTKKP
jgi:hypothetical protein